MKNEEHSSIFSTTITRQSSQKPKKKKMSTFGSPSSDLAKGKKFLEKLLHVQHVDKEKKMTSEIPERTLQHLLADDRRAFHDSNTTENVGNPDESNLDILKSFLKDRIIVVRVYSNPLPFPLGSSSRVTFHAFVVFVTRNTSTNSKKIMWWTLEKNGKYIVLQQSSNKDDVLEKVYDAEKGQIDKRYGRVKQKKFAMGNFTHLKYLLQVIWETNQISDTYHLLYSNCQQFASFIFENLNGERKKWSTYLSATVNLIRGRKKKAAIEVNTVMHQSIFNDDKFDCYRAMMDGRREDFEELIKEMTIECLNSVDSQDYTLLEWATVFSTSHWLIDKFLKEKGAKVPSDEGLFCRNVFFIALQYLPPKKKSKFLSFDGIDIHGVANKTGDTSLHLALYGEKWQIAEDILNRMKDDEVNSTNSLGETALHLAAKLKCEIDLFTKILSRTHSANVNKTDGNGWTALHYAIDQKSRTKVEELLNHKEVNVNIQNNEDNSTALHLASNWPNIPVDLFNLILDKSTDINARDINGNTALHYAITTKSERAIKKLLKHEKVNVNVTNNRDVLALHLASSRKDIPMDLFKQILEKSVNINAQDVEGWAALHFTLDRRSDTKVKELLEDNRVDINVKDNNNRTALHFASMWTNIPSDLFKLILEKSTDVINAQDKDGHTALHWAIYKNSQPKVEKLLAHKDMDVNKKNNKNVTALHLASRWTDIPMDLFNLILKKSTDVNAQDHDGWTALHIVILRNQEVIKVLLKDDRVDVNVKNNENRTALYYCLEWKSLYKIPSDLAERIRIESPDSNAQDEEEKTFVHPTIIKRFKTAIKELLKLKDVDVKSKNKKGRTALHLVCRLSRDDIPDNLIKIIVKQSSDVNAQDNKGDTALHIAMRNLNDVAVEELLKREDLDVNVKNNKNETAFRQSTFRSGFIFVVSLFLPKVYYTRSWRNPQRI